MKQNKLENRTCMQCKYAEKIIYPKENISILKCFGKSNLETISDVTKICDNWEKRK